MSSIKSPQIDFYQHIALPVNMLKISNLWVYPPYSGKSILFWILIVYRMLIYICIFVSIMAEVAYVVKLFLSDVAYIQEIVSVLYLTLAEFLCTVKLLDLTINRAYLSKLINMLVMSNEANCHQNDKQVKIMMKAVKFSRRLFTAMAVPTILAATTLVLVPATKGSKELIVKVDMIFIDVYDERYYKYVIVFQIFTRAYLTSAYCTCQALPWTFMIYAISQFDVLTDKFKNMDQMIKELMVEKKCDVEKAFEVVFLQLITHHQDNIRFVKTLQTVFGNLLTCNITLTGCMIITIAIQLSLENQATDMMTLFLLSYFVIICLNLFADCYLANSITEKSANIATLVYCCPWLNASLKMKKILVIFIARAQEPVVIRAASLVPISLETFTKVMNWTYKGFAVMKQMKK